MFFKISVLKKFANFSRKHLFWKTPVLQALKPGTLLKKTPTLSKKD